MTKFTLFFVGAAFAGVAFAHHSPRSLYVMTESQTVEGIVTEFRLGNPHARIYLSVTNAEGQEESWMAEGGSRTILLRRGWTADLVRPGDRVRIEGQPSRDGSHVIHWETIHFPDGRELYGEDIDFSKIEERRRLRRMSE